MQFLTSNLESDASAALLVEFISVFFQNWTYYARTDYLIFLFRTRRNSVWLQNTRKIAFTFLKVSHEITFNSFKFLLKLFSICTSSSSNHVEFERKRKCFLLVAANAEMSLVSASCATWQGWKFSWKFVSWKSSIGESCIIGVHVRAPSNPLCMTSLWYRGF